MIEGIERMHRILVQHSERVDHIGLDTTPDELSPNARTFGAPSSSALGSSSDTQLGSMTRRS
jgi:hypothetical protein